MAGSSISRASMLLLGIAGALAGCDKGGAPAGQATTVASADEVSPDEATGSAPAPTAGAVDRNHAGEAAPTVSFTDAAGKPATLADYKGKPVVVNLWATWCAPCIKELPSLAAAAKTVGDTPVLALNQDMDTAKAKAFLAAHPIAPVTPAFDAKLGVSIALGVNLPTTVLYGADGKERWRVTGGRDWTSAESAKLLAER